MVRKEPGTEKRVSVTSKRTLQGSSEDAHLPLSGQEGFRPAGRAQAKAQKWGSMDWFQGQVNPPIWPPRNTCRAVGKVAEKVG